MTAIDWNPDSAKLRRFGYASLGGLTLLGLILGWAQGHFEQRTFAYPVGLILLGVAALLVSCFRAQWLRPLYMLIMGVLAIVGPIFGTIVLGLAFFLVFNPLSLFCKWIGQSHLHERIDRAALTCWATQTSRRPASYYIRQLS